MLYIINFLIAFMVCDLHDTNYFFCNIKQIRALDWAILPLLLFIITFGGVGSFEFLS